MIKFKLVVITITCMYILFMTQQFLLNGFTIDAMSGLVINLITEGISILITVLIIGELLKKEEKREKERKALKQKEEHEKLIKEVLGNRLSKLFTEISTVYVNFVTKEPLKGTKNEERFNSHREAINEILENIDTYVVAGFRSKPVKTYIVDPSILNNGIPTEQIISYQKFCYGVFRAKIDFVIGKFIERYISILPDDLRKAIYRIENSIDDFIFVTAYELGFENSPMPTREKDIKQLKENFIIIGQELLYIHKLIVD